MVIHGDGREAIFNAFQVRIEFWMRISNFFEVRESFVRFRGNFLLLRAFIVRHCVILFVERRSPVCESHASKSFSKHTRGIDRMSTAVAYSTERRTNCPFARIAQNYAVRLHALPKAISR